MIFIEKTDNARLDFFAAVQGIESYELLQGIPRKRVIEILLKEQGELCAICERKSEERFAPTIEHFLPKSEFPHLQLNYDNLYVACSACNNPKDHHLIPAYIFDRRFNPFENLLDNRQGLKPIYANEDGECKVFVPAAATNNYTTPVHHSAYILQATLDLMQQNRYLPSENKPDNSNLLYLRASVCNIYEKNLKILTDKQLVDKYRNMSKANIYPEFVSLIAFLYAKEFKKRKIAPPL